MMLMLTASAMRTVSTALMLLLVSWSFCSLPCPIFQKFCIHDKHATSVRSHLKSFLSLKKQ